MAELAALEAERSRGKAVSDLVSVVVGSLGYARYARNPWKRRRTMKPIEPPEGMSPRQAQRISARRSRRPGPAIKPQ